MKSLTLHPQHEQAGARFTELGGKEAVATYGDTPQEYSAAQQGTALHDASYREHLRITGEDRASFLHGMVTNEVIQLPEGQSTYAAMLTAKGAMVADARIVKRPGELLLDTEPGVGTKAKEFLEKYLISEDAEVHDATDDWALLSLLGPKTFDILSRAADRPLAPLPQHASASVNIGGAECVVLGTNMIRPQGADILVPRAQLAAAWNALSQAGARPVGLEALEQLRVEAGVPRYGQDMVETTIPLEANLERAISYNKGCYIGQEVIARATFRGHMNRKLTGLLLGTCDAPSGQELRVGERKVGWVTSVVHSPKLQQRVALAYVHRDFLAPDTRVTLGTGGPEVTVAALPFASGQ